MQQPTRQEQQSGFWLANRGQMEWRKFIPSCMRAGTNKSGQNWARSALSETEGPLPHYTVGVPLHGPVLPAFAFLATVELRSRSKVKSPILRFVCIPPLKKNHVAHAVTRSSHIPPSPSLQTLNCLSDFTSSSGDSKVANGVLTLPSI